MRIAHVTATFPPYHGGTGTVCYYNALGLGRLGHEVSVLTANHPPGSFTYPREITVRRLPVPFRIGNAPLLPDLLRLEEFDIVHLHYPFYFGGEMIFLNSLIGGLRYVMTYHMDVSFAGLLRWPEKLHHLLLGNRILNRAEKVLATSWDYARNSRLRRLLQANPEAIEEIPNGVDAECFHPNVDGRELSAHHGIGREDRVILFVGGLDAAHYFKGVEVLLEALTHLRDVGWKLLVVGDGNLRPAYERQAAELGLRDRVVFCGGKSHEVLPAYYALCDVLVLPSVAVESFGIVLLEAMACGKPVIASDLPGVRSVVTDGEDGLLVARRDAHDLAEKVRILLEDPLRRREMGERGRAKVEERFAWSKIIPGLVKVYEEMLGR